MTEFTTTQRTSRCLQSGAMLLLVCLPMLVGCAVGSDTWYTRISDSDRADHDTGGLPFEAVRGVVSWEPVGEQDVPEKPREEILEDTAS